MLHGKKGGSGYVYVYMSANVYACIHDLIFLKYFTKCSIRKTHLRKKRTKKKSYEC